MAIVLILRGAAFDVLAGRRCQNCDVTKIVPVIFDDLHSIKG